MMKIGKLEFRSKVEAKEFFSSILNSYQFGCEVAEVDFNCLMELILCHPRALEKIGSGVKSIKVDKGFHGKKLFNLVRIDGSIENFSYIKCIDGDKGSFQKLSETLRKQIIPQIKEFKLKHFIGNPTLVCPLTGKELTYTTCHVDHKEPLTFSRLALDFINFYGIDIDELSYQLDDTYGYMLIDEKINLLFDDYHRQNADLQIIDITANLKKSCLGRRSNLDLMDPSR